MPANADFCQPNCGVARVEMRSSLKARVTPKAANLQGQLPVERLISGGDLGFGGPELQLPSQRLEPGEPIRSGGSLALPMVG